jgi:dipeptidyl aminopeptidase/acylaminoacyl peptidase
MLLFEARDSHAGRRSTAYQKVQSAWQPATVSNPEAATGPQIQVVLDEGINAPPKIFVVDPHSRTRSLLVDLNPQFRDLDFAKVEAITWKATDGHQVQGGLYRPPDYQPGNRYPLVIQTHGFKADRFWMDGPWTTAFAAQALAGKGFVVLQVGSAADGRDVDFAITAQEAPREMSAYEGAIDHLEQIGLIDRNRVGIIGFSRTCYLVKYALTHSNYNFSAAVVADGTDAGYFQYILVGVNDRQTVMEHNRLNGAPPFGSGLASWIERSPGFQVDKVRTPLRIQALSPFSVMGEWEWFSALSLLRKPVEMVYLPEAEHILEKPWERMVSQQGDVGWFCFWLKGEEDPDPTKAEQYKRWRELRKVQVQNEKKPANAASSTSN